MPHVPTTAGESAVADLGPVLMHEHVFIRTETLQQGWPGFGGWDTEAEVAAARERPREAVPAGGGRPTRAAQQAEPGGGRHDPGHDRARPVPRPGACRPGGRGHWAEGHVR